jgi:hypothetical protein
MMFYRMADTPCIIGVSAKTQKGNNALSGIFLR